MEDGPSELSLAEIRKFMLANGCKVTNHALVKHFKQFLTNSQTQSEARKQFKTYVNILATIKNDDNQKYLLLRKKYLVECPSEDMACSTDVPLSPGALSASSSPYRLPPPYKPPPEVSPAVVKVPQVEIETKDNYRECVNEFSAAVRKIDQNREVLVPECAPSLPPRNKSVFRANSIENNDKENRNDDDEKETNMNKSSLDEDCVGESEMENSMSVKEATRKFNRMASEEEAKIISPPPKKKPEKQILEEKMTQEVTMAHPKAKEWIVAGAKANYQELAKLASEYPELVKLQDPTTTALHWAAKHENEDIVKLVAGTYKADVNARTGYTPLHIAMQFGKDNIFELLCNTYKANRDLIDWSGNKPLDYRKQHTSVSASTYSKIKARRKHPAEKDLGFLRIGSLNVRVKKTTEAFSNFLGVGIGNTTASALNQATPPHHQQTVRPRKSSAEAGTIASMRSRTSVPSNNQYEKVHKFWGSVDNIPISKPEHMPPPNDATKKSRNKTKHNDYIIASGYSSMPTTPKQLRAPIDKTYSPHDNEIIDSDSDSACGFGSNWSINDSRK